MSKRFLIEAARLLLMLLYIFVVTFGLMLIVLILLIGCNSFTGTYDRAFDFGSAFKALPQSSLFILLPALWAVIDLECLHLKKCKELGVDSNRLSTTQKVEWIVDASLDEAFAEYKKATTCLENTERIRNTFYDKRVLLDYAHRQTGEIGIKTDYVPLRHISGMRVRRRKIKGECIELTLEKVSEHQTKVQIQSRSRVFWGLVDRGQNTVNVERLKAYFQHKQ